MYIKNMVSIIYIHLTIIQEFNLIVNFNFVLVCYMHITFTLSCNYEVFTESLTRTVKDQCDSTKETHNILIHNIARTNDKQSIQELN